MPDITERSPRMPNPLAGVQAQQEAERRDQRRAHALILAEQRITNELLHRTNELLHRLVTLSEHNTATLDAMQQPETSAYSVAGMRNNGAEDDSPFIGG